jgi:hypothetical protein
LRGPWVAQGPPKPNPKPNPRLRAPAEGRNLKMRKPSMAAEYQVYYVAQAPLLPVTFLGPQAPSPAI